MIASTVEFFRQGGYAFFVWGAFSFTFLLLIAEVVQLRRSRRTILSRVGRLVRLRHTGALPGTLPSDAASAQLGSHAATRSGNQSRTRSGSGSSTPSATPSEAPSQGVQP